MTSNSSSSSTSANDNKEWTLDQTVGLTNCDREPIHIPNRIQPHGVLLVLTEPELEIVQVSRNAGSLLGIEPASLLGKKLEILLAQEQLTQLQNYIDRDSSNRSPQHIFTNRIGAKGTIFDAIVHRSDEVLVLELERSNPKETGQLINLYGAVRSAISELQNADSVADLCQKAAIEVRRLTGFDRVMIYRFLEDASGVVLAEAKGETIEPFLGLHYPASDIPQQARRLYLLNRLRLIPDVNYEPSDLESASNSFAPKPLDMSQSVLRSVSPIHIEYLKNMGVTASMSISLVQNSQLWGLVACHHYSPRYVPFDVRNSCELLGEVFSLQIAAAEEAEESQYKLRLNQTLAQFVLKMSKEQNFAAALTENQLNLLDFIKAQGAAVCIDGECTLLGETPSAREIKHLSTWLTENIKQEVFWTDSLPIIYPPAQEFKHLASGLLSVSITRGMQDYVIWFRPETIQTVSWGGNPNKPVETSGDQQHLSPRRSFALWQETVEMRARPWTKAETSAATELRRSITEIVLGRAEQLARLNTELEHSNEELDAFTFVASHDLKEPLRGIHNFSQFLLEDYSDKLDENGGAKLATVMRLTKRMEEMIDSLMNYSRVGRLELSLKEKNLNEVLREVLKLLEPKLDERKISVIIPRPLPVILCDPVRVEQVFQNLLTNAIKYTDKVEKKIEIGFIDVASGETRPLLQNAAVDERDRNAIFYVRDNGIGIRAKHYEQVFNLFKRLHGRDEYEGGTGAGLTIVKKIVERHGGRVWVDSIYGEGTTFYFTLQN